MRQFSTLLLLIFIFLGLNTQAIGAYKGGIEYSIPIEYKNLSASELENKAGVYYHNALHAEIGVLTDDVTNALVLYSILQHVTPENIQPSVRLGILYDRLGKDRYAKGNFSRAIGIDSSRYEPYFYFGEYYYERGQYRMALKYYKRALECIKNPNYDLYVRLGDVYEKFGDTKQALKYLDLAQTQSPNPELDTKIKRIKSFDSLNSQYYKK